MLVSAAAIDSLCALPARLTRPDCTGRLATGRVRPAGGRAACGIQIVAADTAASTVGRMIKDRPHRLDLIYINQPLYFVTFATRDRRSIPSMDCAQFTFQQYAHCAKGKFNVAVGSVV